MPPGTVPRRTAARWFAAIVPVVGVTVAGCALPSGTTTGPAPGTPETIRAPAGQVFFLEARADGVQIYECAQLANAPDTWTWVFRAPEATLSDMAGRGIGRHYAGPTWEANDGSAVVGDVRGMDPGPTTTAIPWLLLTARSTTGTGVFAGTRSIQRVRTEGGLAPVAPCGPGNAKQLVRIPYQATYNFFRAP